ncbi:MAG: HAMP domain-containing sensor histidine kinase [Campylobacterota bacterium]|nr:HAMP domain-containing sensor histidine kinase [Campylobacterota bacterium]
MNKVLSLRNKLILLSLIFMITVFILLQFEHNSSVEQTMSESEQSRNKLLIDTMLPVIRTNLSFGLVDANREYLDAICKDNVNVISVTLIDTEGEKLYSYAAMSHDYDRETPENYKVSRTISDPDTQSLIGSIEVHFSNIYFEKMLNDHQHFTTQIMIMFIAVLLIMLWLLQRAFMPMYQLVELIKTFEPKHDNFKLERTGKYDEIGVIQNALVDMIDRIDLHNRELRELNQTLEEKIKLRTKALGEKKEELEKEIKTVKEQEKMLIAQSRLAAMGEMMSMIAHQWRQPLSTSTLMITNYKVSAMLESKARDQRDDILDQISDILVYLSDTIDDFQTYFKPDKKKERCELHKIIERAHHFSLARLENYGVTLALECHDAIAVETYFNELVQIIINIINNAIDAIVESKSLKKQILITCKEEAARKYIQISDTGGGISDEVLQRVFEPYFSTKGKNGTGLGLYMAKMIVHKHIDGEIKVENIDGGARFSIIL